MHILHIAYSYNVHILTYYAGCIVLIPDTVQGCSERQYHFCLCQEEVDPLKHNLNLGIHIETELSYLAEFSVQHISRIRQHCHAELTPIAVHGNPGCDFHHQTESGGPEIDESLRGSRC